MSAVKSRRLLAADFLDRLLGKFRSMQPPNVHKQRNNNVLLSLMTGLQTGSATSATLQRENKIMPRRMKSICQVQLYVVLICFTDKKTWQNM